MNPSRSRSFVHIFMLLTTLIALVGSAVFVTPAYAASIVVDSNADTVADDGTCTLREAINNANADSDTSVADCTAGSGNDSITFADALAPITLGSALPAISDTAGLTINGGTDITVSGNSLYQVFYVNSGVPLTLNGLTVSNGAGVTQGAGAYNAGGTLTILDSTFSNNSSNGTVGDEGGGGVYNNGILVVTNSIFSGNSAAGSTNQHGGGIYTSSSGTLTIDNSTFSGNTATDGGGAVFANAGTSSITNSIFSGNIANGTGGGGLYYLGAPLSITTSTFSSNSAPSGYGGGIWSGGSTISITNSTFSSNSASVAAYGGGVFATGLGTATIRNSSFSGNSGVNGGGVTVAQGSLNLYNTLIANSSGGHDCLRVSGGTVAGNNNLIEGSGTDACDLTNGSNFNIIGSDPDLGTLTGSPAYFPIKSSSLAFDAGDDTICAAAPVNNESQNSVTRPVGIHCDIGSFELPPAEVDVYIAGVLQASYSLLPDEHVRVNYAGENNGPVQVAGTNSLNVIASTRVIYGGISYSELMGFPGTQLTDEYIFPYYNNVAMNSQLRVSNLGAVPTTITVTLGTNVIDSYTLGAGLATRKNYAGQNDGPLRVSSSATDILATTRVLYNGNSYSELMGFPADLVCYEYIFPYYNNVSLNSQVRVSNLEGISTTITVTLGTTVIDSYVLGAGQAMRRNYAGQNDGPLRVSSSDTEIIATIRALYNGNSYSELMGYPADQLVGEYWYPVYDNVSLNSQLRVSNVGAGSTTITVYSGGTQIDSYSLGAGLTTRKNYAAENDGPLYVVSDSEPILSTIRMLYITSTFSSYYEMTGFPVNQLTTDYWFPWYNNVAFSSELRLGNP